MFPNTVIIDRSRIKKLRKQEEERFVAERPRSSELLIQANKCMPHGVPMSWMASLFDHQPIFSTEGEGAYFIDVDGHRYLDMGQSDLSTICGFTPAPVVKAVTQQMSKGCQFLTPCEAAISVANELAERFSKPQWQFTLSASSANAEAIRVARRATGRETILLFDGKYHGHLDDTLVVSRNGKVEPLTEGLSSLASKNVRIVQYNDLNAVEAVLKQEPVACVIVEPVLTNVGIITPDPGFHQGLWELTRAHGAVLIHDETHTHAFAFGGLTNKWSLNADIVTLGKNFAGGVAIGAYGMSEGIANVFSKESDTDGTTYTTSALTGGTLFGNVLSLTAADAALKQVMTKSAYSHITKLGGMLADGIEAIVQDRNLPWSVQRMYCRSGVTYAPNLPRTAEEAFFVRRCRTKRRTTHISGEPWRVGIGF